MSGVKDLPFAELVRSRMKERGVGLRKLCRAVGVDPSYFSKVLTNKRNPPAEEDVLRKIAAELDIDAPHLVVAAGRIPQQWHRLWSDAGLFRRIHVLLAGAAPSAKTPPPKKVVPAARGWRRAPKTTYVPKELGEELL